MADYTVGQVAEVLRPAVKRKSVPETDCSRLKDLFTVKNTLTQKSTLLTESSSEEKSKNVKRQLKSNKKEGIKKKKKEETTLSDTENTDEPMLDQTEDTEEETPVHWKKLAGAARRLAYKESKKHDTLKDHRTIFVGNLPIKLADKTKLKKLFSKYGTIESLRFRCPPTKDQTTSKRVAVIKKQFHKERDNLIAYVCYKEEFSAEKALHMNGKEVDGHHLRVDISTSNQKSNHNKSIFVGNLPFDIKEEAVRDKFHVCGDIDNIRIVRDNKSGMGKGFCYVTYKKKDCVELALKLNGKELNKRQIRVYRCLKDGRKKNELEMDRQSSKWPREKKKFREPSNKVKHSFQGMKAKKSLKDKTKKRHIPRNSSNRNKQPAAATQRKTEVKQTTRKEFRFKGSKNAPKNTHVKFN